MYFKLAELILTPGKNANTINEIYIAQPDAITESISGKLFILAEIETKTALNVKILNFLIENINRNYYQNEKFLLRERIPSLKTEHLFEAAVAKTNKNLQEYLQNEKIRINPQDFNITVGVIQGGELYFSNTGKNKIFLLYKGQAEQKQTRSQNARNKEAVAEIEYKITNINGTKKTDDSNSLNSEKIFSDVVSGKIPEKAYVLVTNEALPEYISQPQLLKIITALPPLSAIEQLKGMLAQINSYVAFLGIIIKSTTLETPEELIKPAAVSARSSIVDLNRTEATTEDLLSPSGIINLKKWFKLPDWNWLKNKNLIHLEGKGLLMKDTIIMKKKSMAVVDWLSSLFKNVLVYIANFIFFLARTLTNKQALLELWQKIKPAALKNSMGQLWLIIKAKNKTSLVLAIVGICSLLLFTANLMIIRAKNNRAEAERQYQNLTSMIEQKQNQIDATLLYNNEEGAQKLFTEINNLMTDLPQATDDEKTKFTQFKAKIDEQLAAFRKIVKVTPTEVANFKNLNSQASADNIIYVPGNKKVYAGDSGQKSIYIVDTKDKLATSRADFSQTINSLLYPVLTKTNLILYYNKTDITTLDIASDQLNSRPLKITTNKITGANLYNDNLYLLDAGGNKIYKMTTAGNALGAASNYLKENADLANAVAMGIDGHIYVLKNNGELIRFLKGKIDEFKLPPIDPLLSQPTKLFVSPEGKYIYILEPANKRLVVFDKTGNYIQQYQADQFNDLKDFTVDEANKSIYVLAGTTVYNFSGADLK